MVAHGGAHLFAQQADGCNFHACPPSKNRFITGDTLVVDGAAWIYRPQLVPREMVTQLSRGIEAKSRKVGTAAGATRSKL